MSATAYAQIFGYGSLVNRHTLRRGVGATTARIRDWRRSWSHCVTTENGNVCALTVTPSAGGEVAGVVVQERCDKLPELDAREIGYQRVRISLVEESPIVFARGDVDSFTYTSTPAAHRRGSRNFPIWLSYLECVLAGFLDLGGDVAAREFIATTDGWKTPIIDDRRTPKYMRAVQLSAKTRHEVDVLIRSHELDKMFFTDPEAPFSNDYRQSDHEFG